MDAVNEGVWSLIQENSDPRSGWVDMRVLWSSLSEWSLERKNGIRNRTAPCFARFPYSNLRLLCSNPPRGGVSTSTPCEAWNAFDPHRYRTIAHDKGRAISRRGPMIDGREVGNLLNHPHDYVLPNLNASIIDFSSVSAALSCAPGRLTSGSNSRHRFL